MSDISGTLDERGKRYGNYLEQTTIIKNIEDAIHESGNAGAAWLNMEADQKDALYMIIVKMSRILNGDPDYADNWADIAGYATLVKDRLEGHGPKQDN